MVRLEQSPVGLPAQDQRELPGEVVGILQSRVHALPADGTVNVRRVSDQKAMAFPELRRDPVMHFVRSEVTQRSGTRAHQPPIIATVQK